MRLAEEYDAAQERGEVAGHGRTSDVQKGNVTPPSAADIGLSRKDFTPSERVAIAETIREALGERRGRGNVQNLAQYEGQKTRDVAAKKAGFGNAETYRQAKSVTERGIPELVEKMHTAIRVANVPAAEFTARPSCKHPRCCANTLNVNENIA